MLQRRLAHGLAERLLKVQSHSVQAQSTLSYFKGGWASFMRGPTFHASKSVRQAHITFLVPRKKMQALLLADRLRASPVRFTAQRAFLGNKACCRAMADKSAKTRQHTFYARQRSSEYVPSSA